MSSQAERLHKAFSAFIEKLGGDWEEFLLEEDKILFLKVSNYLKLQADLQRTFGIQE